MALQKQLVSIPLIKGMDTKMDDKQEEMGSVSLLENIILDTPKKARKRNGYSLASNLDLSSNQITNLATITSFNNELCLYNDKKFYSFSESNDKWVEKGISEDIFPTSNTIIKNTYTQSKLDANYVDGLCVATWEDSRGGVRFSIVDTSTNNFLLSDFEISSTGKSPKVCNIFNFTFVIYADGSDIKFRKVNTSQPTVVEAEQTIASDYNQVLDKLDAITVNNRIYVAYASDSGEGAGDLSIFYLREDLTVSSTVIEANEAPSNVLSLYTDGLSRIIVTYATETQLKFICYSYSLLVKITNPTVMETVSDVTNASTILHDSLYHTYYEIQSELERDNFIKHTTIDLAANLGTPSIFKRSLGLSSKLFTYNNEVYIPTIHSSPLQSTYFILDSDGNILSKMSPGQGGETLKHGTLPKLLQITDTSFQFISQIKSFLIGQENENFLSSLGVNRTVLDFKINNKNQNATLVGNLHTAGGILRMYDGNRTVEHGFHVFPEGLTEFNQTNGAGMFTSIDAATTFGNVTTANGLDQNAIEKVFIDSGNNVFAVTDTALNLSFDAGLTFISKDVSDGLGSLDIRAVAGDGVNKVFVATSQGISISLDSGVTFTNYIAGAGKQILSRTQLARLAKQAIGPRPGSPASLRVNQLGSFAYIARLNNEITKQRLRNNATGLTSSNIQDVYYHAGTGTLYVIHSTGFDISFNDGTTFDIRNTTDGLGSNTVLKIVQDGSNVYVATTGGFSRSTDGGVTFTNRTTVHGLGSNTILDIAVAGTTIYAATSAGLSISLDSGLTWTNKDLTNGLDSAYINKVYVDSAGIIYVITSAGLNRSSDAGTTFVPRSSEEGLSISEILDFDIDSNDNVFVVGSYGLLKSTDSGVTFVTLSANEVLGSQNLNFISIDSTDKMYIGASSGSLSQGKYQYAAVYRWLDNKGQEHLSAPSIFLEVDVTSAGDDSSVEIQIPTLRLTDKDVVSIEVYRSEVNGTTLYKETSVDAPLPNDVNEDYITFVSSIPDSELIKNEILYTVGGELENIAAPSSKIIEAWNNRIILAGLENVNLLQYSKLAFDNTPVQFNDALTILLPDVGGPLTALKAMDDKLIIFKEDSIYFISGDGPNNLGEQNTFINPELISSDIGCQNPDSLVFTPKGVMFKSDKGIYLLSRGLQLAYIGYQVEAYNGLTVSSAEIIQDKNQVRFLTNAECLVYNYELDKWSVFTNHIGVSATTLNDDYYYIRPDSTIYKENLEDFTDAGSPIKMRIVTSWMSFANVQGFQRIYNFYILGQFYSAHKLLVKVAYNFVEVFTEEKLINVEDFCSDSRYGDDSPYGEPETTPYGGEGNRYQARVQMKTQKCQSIKFSVEDVQSETLGEALDISNFAITMGIKAGLFKPEAGRTVGTK